MGKAARGASAPPDARALYRQLAKAVHPDFARDRDEYALRTRLMTAANAAFERGDASELQELLDEWEVCQANAFKERLERCHAYVDDLAKQLHDYLADVEDGARPLERLGPVMDALKKWIAALK